MSRATKQKHVTKEAKGDLSIPTEIQSIVQLVDSRGNNLHEVMDSAGESYLVSMPVKFRRNIWVKRGDYILVEPIPEGDKVKAEIVKILTREHIRYYRSQGCWPSKFDDCIQSRNGVKENEMISEDIVINTNRRFVHEDSQASDDPSSGDTSDSD